MAKIVRNRIRNDTPSKQVGYILHNKTMNKVTRRISGFSRRSVRKFIFRPPV